MTPAPEKAAPIPAEDAVNTVAGILALNYGREYVTGRDLEVAEEIVRALADREARPSLPDSREERAAEKERLRFEGDLDRWMKTLGAGITGYQPEAYAVMDAACAELAMSRSKLLRLVFLLMSIRDYRYGFVAANVRDAINQELDRDPDDPVCCCGEYESRHTIESGHSFVEDETLSGELSLETQEYLRALDRHARLPRPEFIVGGVAMPDEAELARKAVQELGALLSTKPHSRDPNLADRYFEWVQSVERVHAKLRDILDRARQGGNNG